MGRIHQWRKKACFRSKFSKSSSGHTTVHSEQSTGQASLLNRWSLPFRIDIRRKNEEFMFHISNAKESLVGVIRCLMEYLLKKLANTRQRERYAALVEVPKNRLFRSPFIATPITSNYLLHQHFSLTARTSRASSIPPPTTSPD